jgi:hypothetical protein
MHPVRLTRFVSRYVPCHRLDSLCFGSPAIQHPEARGHSVYHFHPGQMFAVLWWRRHPNDRQHRAVAVVEALGTDQMGHELPGIHHAVAVHAIVDQHGPAGQDGAVDLLLDLIQDLKNRGKRLETLPAKFWTDAVHRILLYPVLSDSPTIEKLQWAN